jgi:hypothetical protein
MGMPAPHAVRRLVDRFDQDRKVFLSADYKEEQSCLEFLNPICTALGWDMGDAIDKILTRNRGSVPLSLRPTAFGLRPEAEAICGRSSIPEPRPLWPDTGIRLGIDKTRSEPIIMSQGVLQR